MTTLSLSILASALPVAMPTAAAAPRSWLLLGALFACGAALVLVWARFSRPAHLALGFATTVTLWGLGYLAMMQPGLVAGDALFGLMLGVLFAGGFVAGRYGGDEVRPVSVGLVAATANLLILGAFLRDERHGSTLTPLLYLVGLFGSSAGLSWLGGVVGRRYRSATVLPPASALFSLVAAGTVFLLLVTGGLVTSLESGLAVPDWPNSFGHNMLLYPVSEMKGGVYYEHAHRLYGMLVGTTTLVLVSVIWRCEERRWLRILSIAILLMVCFQGYLGGTRVTGHLTLDQDRSVLEPSTQRAIIHGVFAQIIFSSFLVMAAATSSRWVSIKRRVTDAAALTDRGAAILLPHALLVQLIFGALYRHLQPSGGVSAPGHPIWAIYAHITMAVVVVGLVILAAGRAISHSFDPVLRRLGIGILVLAGLQITLGVVAVAVIWTRMGDAISPLEAFVTTAHQATGAALLGASVLLGAWSRRLLGSEESRGNYAASADGVVQPR